MMTSTELKIGLTNSARPSSRVLKPPGGGHSNIFAEPEVSMNAPRPKYNQQNSSNLNACMGSIDPNKVVEKMREEIAQPAEASIKQSAAPTGDSGAASVKTLASSNGGSDTSSSNAAAATTNGSNRGGRVPPGGYSSGGFW